MEESEKINIACVTLFLSSVSSGTDFPFNCFANHRLDLSHPSA